MKDSHQLGEWIEGVGLEMYRGLIEAKVPSGDRLVTMTRQRSNADMVVSGARVTGELAVGFDVLTKVQTH